MAGGFELFKLIAEAIADAALQEAGNVLVELAVLAPQGGYRHNNGRLNVS